MILMLAVEARAAGFKHQLLGPETQFDAIATGSDGTHIILDDFSHVGDFYSELIGFKNRVSDKQLLPLQISKGVAMTLDSQNQPHLLYYSQGTVGGGGGLTYSTFSNGTWTTLPVPDPG